MQGKKFVGQYFCRDAPFISEKKRGFLYIRIIKQELAMLMSLTSHVTLTYVKKTYVAYTQAKWLTLEKITVHHATVNNTNDILL